MMRKLTLIALTSALAGAALPAAAQDYSYGSSGAGSGHQYVLDLGVGALVKPRYDGADSYLVSPVPLIFVSRFYLPILGQVADGQARTGIYFYPSFNFIGERKPSDAAELNGTRKVNWALEAGLGAGFQGEAFRVFGELRQGFNGHTGQTGQIGADLIMKPMPKLELSAGPRLGFASSDYMDTYFSVSQSEAQASGLNQFRASGGFKSIGVASRASYDLTEQVKLHVEGSYDRLIGDAARSPIVRNRGSRNQYAIGTGVTYRFSFDAF
ncbi:MipA/OmpV family protein [Pannonibacter phragmitetus]|uniref:MipA/OmpV family protein n=1 Tax=Pannonibacter phragmitetus TaxID=121719 RepID=UPI003D2ECA54